MNLKNKRQRKILFSLKKDINIINFKLKHKNLEKVKNEISRRGKINFCKGRLYAPYVIALGLSIGAFSIFGATPFVLDKSKKYQKIMKEIDSDNHTRIITQYDNFDSNENVITLYEKWKKNNDDTYSRNIKVYKLGDLSEDKILMLLNEKINSFEEIFNSPITENIETRNYLDKNEFEKDSYLSARIYLEDCDDFIYIKEPIGKNVAETILWLIVLFIFEFCAFIYRGLSSFSYSKVVRKINNMYSINTIEMLEQRLNVLMTNYRILKQYDNIDINNLNVLKYLDSKKNVNFSKLSNNELRDVLIIAMETELVCRDTLSFEELYTYGIEIELEHVKLKKICKSLVKYRNLSWILMKDCSLNKGVEIVSPILRDKKEYWNELNDVCKSTNKIAFIDKNCGFHVHVGAHILGYDTKAWINFIKLFSTYENIIFRFAYGEFYNYRDNILEYAPPVSDELWRDYLYLKEKGADLREILYTIKHGKYNAINFDHVKFETVDKIIKGNTVEIRCGNGCKNPIIIQNYINFILSLFRYAKSDKFNDELIDKRHEMCIDIYGNIDMYDEVYLEQVIELIDEIFDNNLDKIYFLNQYLKDFKIERKFNKNKTFTKKLKK